MSPDQLPLWDSAAGEPLRWSISRYHRFKRCARQYYLFHYGTRPEYPPLSAREKRELLVLRSLRTRHMWVGQIVHSVIEQILKSWESGQEPSLDAMIDRGVATMRQQYKDSRNGRYREQPLRWPGLLEHEYEHAVSRDDWRRLRDQLEACLRRFFELDLVRDLRSLPRWRWLAVETLAHFDLEGARVVVRPDLAWRAQDDGVVILDWKTGLSRGHGEDLQLGVYGLFAERAWGLGGDALTGITVYLADGGIMQRRIDRDELRRFEGVVRESALAMRRLVAAGPVDALARFPMTDDHSHCARCPFRRVCGR